MMNKWHGLMKIELFQLVRNGEVIYEERDIYNTLHFMGELFCLSALFTGGNNPNTVIPDNYYIGLDNRATISAADTMQTVLNEPVGNGYSRQLLSSASGFTTDVAGGVHRAVGNIVTFNATGVGWGPVSVIWITDKADNSGTLIASAPLSTPIQPASGDSVNMRMAMQLKNCP
jgi:hypothetical protein